MSAVPSYESAPPSESYLESPRRGTRFLRVPTPPPAASIAEISSEQSILPRRGRDHHSREPRLRALSPRIVYHDLPPEDPRWPPQIHSDAETELRAGTEDVHIFYYRRSKSDSPSSAETRFPRNRHRSVTPESRSSASDIFKDHRRRRRDVSPSPERGGYSYFRAYDSRGRPIRRFGNPSLGEESHARSADVYGDYAPPLRFSDPRTRYRHPSAYPYPEVDDRGNLPFSQPNVRVRVVYSMPSNVRYGPSRYASEAYSGFGM